VEFNEPGQIGCSIGLSAQGVTSSLAMVLAVPARTPIRARSSIAASEAGQMAASDYEPMLFKNRLHFAGRPQMSTRPNEAGTPRADRGVDQDYGATFIPIPCGKTGRGINAAARQLGQCLAIEELFASLQLRLHPMRLLSSAGPCLGGVFWILIFGKNLRIGTTRPIRASCAVAGRICNLAHTFF
jgi:hypothetical protein